MKPMQTASSVAALSKALPAPVVDEYVGTEGVERIAKDQEAAKRSRGMMKGSAKRATEALVALSHTQIVLAHVHPRWLRNLVEKTLDAGENVTQDDIDRWRAAGPGMGAF